MLCCAVEADGKRTIPAEAPVFDSEEIPVIYLSFFFFYLFF